MAIVDRAGIVRAIGISPSNLDAAVSALLAEQPSPAKLATQAVQDALGRDAPGGGLLEGGAERRAAMAANLEGRPMPPLGVRSWANARAIGNGTRMPDDARLVVMSFYDSADAAAGDRLAALHRGRAAEGVIAIGVLTDEDNTAARRAMRGADFPVAHDRGGRVAATYGADAGDAETYLIRPDGLVLAGDVAEATLDDAVTAALGALE